ncbi:MULTISPECIES: efflux RND transporter periplasmic adaptor subunit [unclassified Undibacterium]|uniref:efflux RND transporter periplasmic adaptor subunit n=1 Tax=unclassified Undibacterium TaxID=2630295 RepID=UPI002AC95F9D|nr:MULTISPECIES: efflux RND transporter periplasmic adaptor subunit [unclassified Undibacterium]MEB0138872.1 efflux RND transporter periplasmic adaptor subunit [Undibacterium sp. CCC2.1]MEB0172266.1 efflux RND transporter periplasmic adaptor subunit [Undibacterium sp. CCC1.1]MEB0176117.1 efflux RND transporter periplasmic adaptor subunit [Undibacterium sp. CCC3.4]MEB0215922.1 efflux RND transporter periplasmic adaptor subunit [Undibacterium sp. 5I2]WPX44742.1 efflux RND transporter periplasmic
MLPKLLFIAAIGASLVGCSNQKDAEATKSPMPVAATAGQGGNKTTPALLIAPEDVFIVSSNEINSGPVITGSVQPERKADLRAEVQAIVLQVLKENGDGVKRGDVLVRLDETAIRDNLNSAEDNARSATLAMDQADRSLQRLKTLRASGMTSLQALDDAELKVDAARSEVSAARARATTARQQLQRTVVRAPFDGVVSERKVSAGDTATLGKELVKVIDPTSMRFVGNVSADKIAIVKVGQVVSFRINGYTGQEFHGKVTRVDPAANDVTRQVEVQVGFIDANQPRVAGLFAEGVIEASTVNALTLPEAALVRAGDQVYVWRVAGTILKRVDVVLGKREQRSGNYEVRSGLAPGDVLMRSPNSGFHDAQTITRVAANKAAPVAPAVRGN